MPMDINKLYTHLLKTAGLVVDDEGLVSTQLVKAAKKKALTIDGKRLVIPTKKNLANFDPDKLIVFHPLHEHVMRGESEVILKLRKALNHRMNFIVGTLSLNLLRLAVTPGQHENFDPNQVTFLSKMKDADEKTYLELKKLVEAVITGETSLGFVNLFLKRGGFVSGKKHARVASVTFPFYEELVKVSGEGGTREMFGHKLRVKDFVILKALFEYILPDLDKPEAYFRGSDSQVAPFTDALMKAVIAVGSRINDVVDVFKDHLEDHEDFMFDAEWVDDFESLEALLPQIRMIPSTIGDSPVEETKALMSTAARNMGASTAVTMAPPPAPAPVAAPPAGPRNWNPLMAGATPPPPPPPPPVIQAPQMMPPQQQPVYHQPPPYQPMGYPPMNQGYGYAPAPPPLAANPDGTVSMRAILQSRPDIAAQVAQPMPGMGYGNSYQVPQRASLANPNPGNPYGYGAGGAVAPAYPMNNAYAPMYAAPNYGGGRI